MDKNLSTRLKALSAFEKAVFMTLLYKCDDYPENQKNYFICYNSFYVNASDCNEPKKVEKDELAVYFDDLVDKESLDKVYFDKITKQVLVGVAKSLQANTRQLMLTFDTPTKAKIMFAACVSDVFEYNTHGYIKDGKYYLYDPNEDKICEISEDRLRYDFDGALCHIPSQEDDLVSFFEETGLRKIFDICNNSAYSADTNF